LVRNFPRWSGATAFFFGMLVVASWYAHWRSVLQMVPDTAPMQYNAALCFILCGLGLILLTTSRARIAPLLGCVVGIFCLLTLIEYIAGWDLGIDQRLFRPYFEAASAFPGRMSPLTACCFVLLGIAIAQIGTGRTWLRVTSAGLLACIVVVIAVVALAGYAFGIDAAYGWGAYSRMAVNTAAGFLVLGSGVLVLALGMAKAENRGFLRWLPVTGSMTLMLMIAFVAAMNRADLQESTFWRQHTIAVILAAQSFEENLVAIQRGLRGYVTSGDQGALASHENEARLEPQLFNRLVELTSDNPTQQARLGQLAAAMKDVLAYDRRALEVYSEGGFAAISKMDSLGESRSLVGKARVVLKAFSQEEQRLLDVRDASEQRNSRNGARLLVFGSITAAALLAWANYAVAREMARRNRVEVQRECLIEELRHALAEVKALSGMIPICGWCKSVRTDKGYWQSVEQYVSTHSEATFTHGICPACSEKLHEKIEKIVVS
jgi:CHASE3 domain sensor protein